MLRFLLALLLPLAACAENAVSFRAEIAPLLQRRCAQCHNEENAKGSYRLDTFARMKKAGESEFAPVVAGKARESELYRLLIEPAAEDRMPQKADPLPPEELALIERWLNEGATYDGGEETRPIVELARETFLHAAPEHYARPEPITALAFSPDGTQLAVAGYFEVTLWDAATGALVRRIGGMPERITALAWDPQTRLLAVAGGAPSQWGAVLLVDPANDFHVRVLCDLPETALSVAFSPDGTHLLAGAGDKTIRLFELPGGKQTRLWRAHADWVQSVAYNRDGTRFVTASRDRTARVFDATTGELHATYDNHEAPVLAAILMGNTALSLAKAQPPHSWDSDTGKNKARFDDALLTATKIAPLGYDFLTGGTDGLLRVVQITDRRVRFILYGHHEAIESLAIAPGGSGVFASGAHDGEVCIWNLACGTWTRRFLASP